MGVFLVPLNPDDIDSRLHFFLELLSINSNFYLWTYASDGTLMHTNCQDLVLEKFLKVSGYFDYLIAHRKKHDAVADEQCHEHGLGRCI